MEQTIWEQIANIPWPFYVIFFMMVHSGYRTTKTSFLPVRVLYLLPAVFILASFISVQLIGSKPIISLAAWVFGFLTGIMAGWSLYRSLGVKAVKDKKQIYIPGNLRLLLIILAVLSLQFLNQTLLIIKPEWQHLALYANTWLIIGGFFSGLFIGRLIYALRCLKKGPYLTAPSH